ncbi:hypothetical protein NP233_g11614 [Leucocoprinus birnbaumii]|uniref:Uncharacterized protein n=1 Tax=Leucocoprinus birnbaumii TaxID=56174 RepID=A0AAD5VM11_9AGAR|nr:hypothetical protein NP233_g11614 [Leucocoprinus birnbaumii]
MIVDAVAARMVFPPAVLAVVVDNFLGIVTRVVFSSTAVFAVVIIYALLRVIAGTVFLAHVVLAVVLYTLISRPEAVASIVVMLAVVIIDALASISPRMVRNVVAFVVVDSTVVSVCGCGGSQRSESASQENKSFKIFHCPTFRLAPNHAEKYENGLT